MHIEYIKILIHESKPVTLIELPLPHCHTKQFTPFLPKEMFKQKIKKKLTNIISPYTCLEEPK